MQRVARSQHGALDVENAPFVVWDGQDLGRCGEREDLPTVEQCRVDAPPVAALQAYPEVAFAGHLAHPLGNVGQHFGVFHFGQSEQIGRKVGGHLRQVVYLGAVAPGVPSFFSLGGKFCVVLTG